MKKISKINNLRLNKQTILTLVERELDQVVGGAEAAGSLNCTVKGNSLCVDFGCT